METKHVIIIGAGPAGMTAALYTARAQLQPLVIVGNQLGGQVALTHEIENYPGFVETLSGAELTDRMKKQSERFGAEYIWDSVTEVDLKSRPFKVQTHAKTYEADSIIITVGANPRQLNVPGEKEFTGRGVSYCATCDVFFTGIKKW